MIASKAGWTRKKPRAHYIGVMSLKMFLIFRGKPSINSCRDGGSIIASYTNIFGSEYTLTLPIKWGGTREDMKVVGYREPKLEKRLSQKKISKGVGSLISLVPV